MGGIAVELIALLVLHLSWFDRRIGEGARAPVAPGTRGPVLQRPHDSRRLVEPGSLHIAKTKCCN